MTKIFLRTTQVLIFLNLLCQLFWIFCLNFRKTIQFSLAQLEILLCSVGMGYLLAGIFIGIYLYKKRFKISSIALIIQGSYYLFLLVFWYQLICFNVSLASYETVYYCHLLISFFFGFVLILSETRKRIWIKRVGIVIVILFLVNITILMLKSVAPNASLEKIRSILGFTGAVTSIFWMLNFQKEIKSIPFENESLLDAP